METSRRYAKNYVQLVCTKQINGQTHYLIYKRDFEPFKGCTGFPSGKIEWGEKIPDAASRELFEETGLLGNPTLKIIIHYIFYKNGNVEQDEYMFVCHADEPAGNLTDSYEGKNMWVSESSLPEALKAPFVPLENYLRIIHIIKEHTNEIKLLEVNIDQRKH